MKVELRGITKRFPGVVANQGVDLSVQAGEVLALLGENGAGKSTLMNMLYGLYRPDEGQILVDGAEVTFRSPADAIAAGIGMVHQHFMLVPVFTVTENLMLGNESTRGLGQLDVRAARSRIVELSERYGLSVDPDALVEDLPVGVQQRAEILKALYRDADCLILDEPTAVLTPSETAELEAVVRGLADAGKSIIFISHKLGEVMRLADTVAVLRGGRVVETTTPAETDAQGLASMMVGRDVQLVVDKAPAAPGSTVLSVQDLVVADSRGHAAVDGVSFELRAGEILAVAGVQGNGQTELVEALTGLRRPAAGTVVLDGRDVTGASPRALFGLGVGHVPEDRQRDGAVGAFSVEDNMVLNSFRSAPYARGWARDRGAVRRNAEALRDEYDVRTPSVEVPISTLSGGNQQKVIVAREFSHADRLLVAAQPTRGLDVGSIQYIHRRIVDARNAGAAVLIVSAELDEVLALADRIAVMCGGRFTGVVDRAATNREQVGLMMTGTPLEQLPPLRPDRDGVPDATPLGELLDDEEIR
jgi:simple sugar transport system ATP-binding protein